MAVSKNQQKELDRVKHQPQFLIANYIPDLHRMEPRNIGIFVWAPGILQCRFLPDHDASKFVRDPANYQRWVRFWTKLSSAKYLTFGEFDAVPISSIQCLDVLRSTQDGNYKIGAEGAILDEMTTESTAGIVDQLYAHLVRRPVVEESPGFSQIVNQLLDDSGMKDLPQFHQNRSVPVKLLSQPQDVKLHYVVGDQSPRAVFQRVDLTDQSSVLGTSFLFEHLKANHRKNAPQLVGFVQISKETEARERTEHLKSVLTGYASHVLNVSEPKRVIKDLKALKRQLVAQGA